MKSEDTYLNDRRKYYREYYRKNREKILAKRKEPKFAEKTKAYLREYRGREEFKKKRRESLKERYANDKQFREKVRARQNAYYHRKKSLSK